jgi:hypothetical protein
VTSSDWPLTTPEPGASAVAKIWTTDGLTVRTIVSIVLSMSVSPVCAVTAGRLCVSAPGFHSTNTIAPPSHTDRKRYLVMASHLPASTHHTAHSSTATRAG